MWLGGDSEKWNRIATTWLPYGQKKKRGRPATRWVDKIIRYVGPHWASNAFDRVHRKKVVEAYARRWVD